MLIIGEAVGECGGRDWEEWVWKKAERKQRNSRLAIFFGHLDAAVHGTTDWFQIGKGVRQGCLLSPCLFNLYAEYAQARIKIAGRNINNLRYADDTTLMAESEEELKAS